MTLEAQTKALSLTGPKSFACKLVQLPQPHVFIKLDFRVLTLNVKKISRVEVATFCVILGWPDRVAGPTGRPRRYRLGVQAIRLQLGPPSHPRVRLPP